MAALVFEAYGALCLFALVVFLAWAAVAKRRPDLDEVLRSSKSHPGRRSARRVKQSKRPVRRRPHLFHSPQASHDLNSSRPKAAAAQGKVVSGQSWLSAAHCYRRSAQGRASTLRALLAALGSSADYTSALRPNTANSSAGSVQSLLTRQPDRCAAWAKPATSNLRQVSVWMVSPCANEKLRPATETT